MSAPDYDERLRPILLYHEGYYVAFAPGHRFEQMNAVPLRELTDQPYIKRLHCEFPANFEKLNIPVPYGDLKVRYMTERQDWVQAMVVSGLGCAVMPKYLPILDGISMRPLVEPEVARKISIVTVAGRPHSKPVSLAVRTAQTLAWDGVGDSHI